MSEPNPITMAILMLLALLFGCVTHERSPPLLVPQNAPPTNETTWWDAVEGRWWVIGDRPVAWDDAAAACSGAYSLAGADDLRNARTRGICTARECTSAWGVAVSRKDALTIDFATGTTPNKPKTEAAAVALCMEVKK